MGDTHTAGLARLSQIDRDALTVYAARAAWPAGFAIYQRGGAADGVFVVTRGRVVLRSRVRAGRGLPKPPAGSRFRGAAERPVRLRVRSAAFQAAEAGFDSRTGYWKMDIRPVTKRV